MKIKLRMVFLVLLLLTVCFFDRIMVSKIAIEDVEAKTSSTRKVKDKDYTKLVKGNLSKREIEKVFEAIHTAEGYFKGKKTSKEFNEDACGVSEIALTSLPYEKSDKTEMFGQNIISMHALSDANRIMSFFSKFRFKPNQYYDEKMINPAATDDTYIYYLGYGYDYEFTCEIVASTYDKDTMMIEYSLNDYTLYDGNSNSIMKKWYVATLKKSNGKFILKSIKGK